MERLRQALRFGKEKRRLEKGEEARQIWADIYPELSEGKPGLLGAVIGRAEAQVMRLSCLYAVLDCSASILKDHLLAALALWEYAENSASYIFGNALGDPVADELLALIRNSPEGVTRTNIRDHFKRNKSKEQIERALEIIRHKNLVRVQIEQTGGRPVERWFSIQSTT